MRLLFTLFLYIPLWATTTLNGPIQTSAQQAMICVRTDQAGVGTYIISTNISLTPVVDDNNATLFPGANLDTRDGSIVNGNYHCYIAGIRTGATASDSIIHSRSLTASTTYYGSAQYGADAAVTFSFTTQTVAFGATFAETPPFAVGGFGNYGWPTINWLDQSKEYTDPLTGVLIKRATGPGWWGSQRPPIALDNQVGGVGWTNPSRVLNGSACDGTAPNCGVTGNTNKLFLGMYGNNFSNGLPTESTSAGFSTIDIIDDFIALVYGQGSDAMMGNRQLNICLTFFDSATCDTATQTVTLGTTPGTVGFPANGVGQVGGVNTWSPQFQFGEWGGTAPLRGDFAASYGTVTITGGINVALTSLAASYNYFSIKWKTGALIQITGSGCTAGGTDVGKIQSVTDQEHLILQADTCGNPVDAPYHSMASGIIIWKTNATGTLTIGVNYSYAYSATFKLLAEGDGEVCSRNPVTVSFAADGVTPLVPSVPGKLCFLPFMASDAHSLAGGLLFLLTQLGETRLLSNLFSNFVVNPGDAVIDQNTNQIAYNFGPWDKTDPLKFYGLAPVGSGKTSIFSAAYDMTKNFKAYSHPLWPCGVCYIGGPAQPGQDPTIAFPGGRWPDDPIIYANITKPSDTPAHDVYTQILAANPSYDTSVITANNGIDRILGGYAFIQSTGGSQDSICTVSTFDLATGLIHGVGDSWTTYPGRWGGCHSSFQSGVTPGAYALALNPPGAAGGFAPNTGVTAVGPHQITPYSVLKGGVFNTDTSLTAASPLDACPANPFGFVGNNCMTIRTQDVCSHSPRTSERVKWPCPYNMANWSQITPLAAGDGLVFSGGNNENGQVISSTPTANVNCNNVVDCVEIVVGRGAFATTPRIAPNPWTAYAIPPGGQCNFTGCSPGVGIWVAASQTNFNTNWLLDPQGFAAHADAGTAPTPGHITFPASCIYNTNYHVRYDKTLAAMVGTFVGANVVSCNGPFNGVSPSLTFQSYPSNEQYNAIVNEKHWFSEFHHMNGSNGFTFFETPSMIDPIAYALVGGTSSVYKFTTIAGGLAFNAANYKNHAFGGYAGRFLWKDMSSASQGNLITDATPWGVCGVLVVNECRTGSAVGDVYATVPNLPAQTPQPNCFTDWLTESLPCAFFPNANASWLMQIDGSQSYSNQEFMRHITMGFTGWGRQYQFNTFISDPDGKWGFYKCDWCDGIRSEVMIGKFSSYDPIRYANRSGFINFPIQLGSSSTYAEAQFGYIENGTTSSFYCMGRADACNTSGTPYGFEGLPRVLQSCVGGCTIQIPAISGRMLYYRVRRSSDGTTWTSGPLQATLIP